MERVTKSQIVEEAAKSIGITKVDMDRAVKAFLGHVAKQLEQENEVILTDIGVLIPVRIEARQRRNPSTGEKIQVPASRSVKFRVSGAFKKQLSS